MELQIGTGWHSGKHRDSRSPRQICRAPLEQQREDRAWGREKQDFLALS